MLGVELKRDLLPAISGPNSLVLRFAVGYNQGVDYWQAPERVGRIEAALRKVTGRAWTVKVEAPLVERPAAAGQASGSEAARPRRSPKEEAEKVPLVKRALEVFGAAISRVDDAFGTAVPAEREGPAGTPQEEPQ
jgi:hypothetical protein